MTIAFEKLDTDENGVLSLQEMEFLYKEMKASQDVGMLEAFINFDKDRDSYLSLVGVHYSNHE